MQPELEMQLRTRFDVVDERFEHGGVCLDLIHPRDADALIDEEAFGHDERLPYWAELWPAAKALARWVLDGGLSGACRAGGDAVVELGCGVGLPALAVARAGLPVLATDYYEDALRFVEVNAARNGLIGVGTHLLDWREAAGASGGEGFSVVMAADVLYEERHARDLAGALPRLLAAGGRSIIADPGRKYRPLLEETMRSLGWRVHELAKVEEPAAQGATSVVTLIELSTCGR